MAVRVFGTWIRCRFGCGIAGASSTMAASAPPAAASDRNWWPSNLSPRSAMNKQAGSIRRESVHTVTIDCGDSSGCGGDRDRTKRPRMAKIAEKLADEIYITSDNPRTEDPKQILDQIVAGLSADTDKLVCVEHDRRMAIQRVLSDAAPGDIVLIAGKGHENYQILGKEKHHFDDVEEALRVLGQKTAA